MRSGTLVVAGLIAVVAAGCAPSETARLEANKNLVRRFGEALNTADWGALDELVTEDFTRHSQATAGPPITSREGFIQLQKTYLAAFPDQRVTVEKLIAEGDEVAGLFVYSGTNTGPIEGAPPTGSAVELATLGLFRIEEGRIAELWVEWDNVAMLTQLGLFPPPQSPPGE